MNEQVQPIGVNTTIPALRALGPGENVVYHRGHLAHDKTKSEETRMIALIAMQMSDAGQIHLTQRRISKPRYVPGPGGIMHETSSGFEYIATGALPRHV